MSMSRNNQVWLVTGAGAGLGRGMAVALAEQGATVVLAGKTIKHLEATYDMIVETPGPEPAIYPINLLGASVSDYDDMTVKIDESLGRLDGVVHAAVRFDGLMPVAATKPKDWAATLHVNLTAPQLITQACLPLLERDGGGRVIVFQDAAAAEQRAFWGGYSVAKAGLAQWAALMGQELENTSAVRIELLSPPPMYTALRRMAFPAELPGQQADPLQVARDLLNAQ